MSSLTDKTTIVVGASRGLGRGIATAFAQAGAPVVAVARTGQTAFGGAGRPGAIHAEVADAADATVAAGLLGRYEPAVLVLVAGATPYMRPLHEQTWETFSVHWRTDVRITFEWLREALLTPLAPGSHVVVVSSGAALNPNGSPLSGGYAGAKATQRLITALRPGRGQPRRPRDHVHDGAAPVRARDRRRQVGGRRVRRAGRPAGRRIPGTAAVRAAHAGNRRRRDGRIGAERYRDARPGVRAERGRPAAPAVTPGARSANATTKSATRRRFRLRAAWSADQQSARDRVDRSDGARSATPRHGGGGDSVHRRAVARRLRGRR